MVALLHRKPLVFVITENLYLLRKIFLFAQALETLILLAASVSLAILNSTNESLQNNLSSCVWFISFDILVYKFIQGVTIDNISFFSKIEY